MEIATILIVYTAGIFTGIGLFIPLLVLRIKKGHLPKFLKELGFKMPDKGVDSTVPSRQVGRVD